MIVPSRKYLGCTGMPRCPFHDENGELGTDDFAQVAVDTGVLFHNVRIVVSFPVEFRGHGQHGTGTVFHTKTASFALVDDDVNIPVGNFDFVNIQWNTPVGHRYPYSA
jgi:hypothetical protein